MPYIPKMKEILASILALDSTDISIKAKTKENGRIPSWIVVV